MDDSTTAAGAFCRGTRPGGPSHKHTRCRRRRRHGMNLSAAALCWWTRRSWSSHNHARCRRRRRGMDFAASALCRGTRRRGPSQRHNCARCYRRHRRSGGMDLPAAALPRRAGTPFRGRSGCGSARRPEPRGRRRSRIHSPRRTRQTDDWSWAMEGGDDLGRRVPQQLPRELCGRR